MRRERKNNSKVKILTAATLATLLAAGTLNAYASTQGIQRIGIQVGDQIRYMAVSDLDDETFRTLVITAFNTRNGVWVSDYTTGAAREDFWREISMSVSPGDMADRAPRDVTQDPPLIPYEWD